MLRRVAIDWGRASRWEDAVGEAGTRVSFQHSPAGRGVDVALLVAVPLGAVLLAPIVLALYYRGERRLAAACVALFAGSLATTELLKTGLDPRYDVPQRVADGYPSGHTTIAFATGIVLVLAAPWRGRLTPLAVGAGYVAFVAAGVVLDGWHLPSDAAGALLVTGAWTLGAFAVLDPPVQVTVSRHDALGAGLATALAVVVLLTHLGAPMDAPLVRQVAEAVVLVGAAAAAAMLTIGLAVELLGARPAGGPGRSGEEP